MTKTRDSEISADLRLTLSADGRLRRLALLSGMGLSVAGLVIAPPTARAAGPAFGTPAWTAQRAGAQAPAGAAAAAAGRIDVTRGTGSVTTAEQAAQRTQRSVANLSRAAEAIAGARSAQTAAAAIALDLPSDVPNGLTPGGLEVAARVAIDPSLWQNAELPTQTTGSAGTQVTVEQTASRAILTWDSFNIGRETTLHIDQTGGTTTRGSNDWIALNRVTGNGAAPSQILGKLQAEGTVYLINNNGIIFGAGSQVNTNSLIATSLNLYNNDAAIGNRTFLDANQGITSFVGQISPLLPPGSVLVDPGVAGGASGNIDIERGAAITTAPLGFSLIAAPNVANAGRIRAQDGQAILIGARNVLLEPDGGNATRTAARLRPYTATLNGAAPATTVRNTGLIESTRGNVTLIARDVQQNGVLSITSGISNPGSIVLTDGRSGIDGSNGGLGTGRVSFGADAVTAILPDRSVSETTTSSSTATQSFVPGRIEIDAAIVNFGENSLLKAPGARLDIRADGLPTDVVEAGLPGRVYVDRNAQLDLSGLANVRPLAGSTLVTVARIGQNELANSPVQRNAFLFRQTNVVVDGQVRGVRADGTPWVGSPLLNATGIVEQTPRAIDELLTRGGSITVNGAQFITREGSLINLDGGYLRYGDAARASTRLITADGHLVNIGEADPLRAIAGFAGTQFIDHARYSITQTFVDPIIGGRAARLADGYIEGGNAGSLRVTANVGAAGSGNGLLLFGGDVSAQALAGREQIRNGSLPSGGSFDLDTLSALVIRDTSPLPGDLAANFNATTQISPAIAAGRSPQDPANLQVWTALSGVQLANAGFSSLNLAAAQVIVEAGQGLRLQAGSSISLSGGRLDIGADLVTAGGSIRLLTATSGSPGLTSISFVDPASTAPLLTGDIVVRDGVTLSTRGRFVNDAYLAPDERHGSAFIDGGSISLRIVQTNDRRLLGGVRDGTGRDAPILDMATDTTGNIRLGVGSRLDVTGGGYIDANGNLAQRDRVPFGSGGSVSLETYPQTSQQGALGILAPAQAELGRIIASDGDLSRHLLAYGFSGGGTLRLRTLGLQIGGDPASIGEALYLSPDFFSRQGFANYDLSAAWDATIAADTTVRVSHRNLVAGFVDILSAATGADLYAPAADGTVFATLDTLDDFRRSATGFNLTSGDYLNANIFAARNAPRDPNVRGTTLLSAGASIVADAGASIRLASTNQVTVLGSITAHGGSITLSGDSSRALGSNRDSGLSPPSDPFASIYTSLDKSVWLGAEALLDVSGVSLRDPLAASVLDAGGQRVTPRIGRVLDGGTVTLTSDSGHVIALAGSRIEASGTQDRYDLLEFTGSPIPGQQYRRSGTDTLVYSDGGEIRLGTAGGLLFDGSLHAAAGAAEARGGRLSIIAEDAPTTTRTPNDTPGQNAVRFVAAARSLLFSQSGMFVPQGLLPGEEIEPGMNLPDSLAPITSGRLYFAADRLNGSGIDDLVIGQRLDLSPLTQPLTIAFAGDVRLAVPGSITIAAHRYLALPAGSVIIPDSDAESIGAPQINLEAAYISFGGTTFNSRLGLDIQTRVNDAVLTVNAARGLDLVGNFALQNFAQSTFRTQGDIRLYSPVGNNLNLANTALLPGSLFTGGNLTLAAAQIYPASGNRFILAAAGPSATTIRFEQTAAAPTALPLSAGGSLLVDASTIEQAGTLRAPSGQIRLGVSDPLDPAALALFGGFRLGTADGQGGVTIGALPLVATSDVQLAAGSLTSVSSAGLVVPYGFTVDGRELQYDAVFGSQLPAAASLLSAAPAKQVSIEAANIALDDGARVDLSGGGDLQSQEFVPGTGGTRDLLARSSTAPGSTQSTNLFPDGREVYAIIPGYQTPAGAYDPAIDSAGNGALVGRSVHLSGVGNLPEGDYILLPARYATLPGAYRVVQDTGSRDSIAAANVVLADGSYLSAGYFQDGYARVGRSESARDARSTRFIVQTTDVWQQYSQYTLTSANDYFSRIAADAGTVAAQRPLDAGQLVLAATRSINIDATLNAAGGQRTVRRADGSSAIERGNAAQVDIAARDIQIIGSGAAARDGYVQLAVGDLNGIGAASLLIGGVRSADSAGTTIRALANSVVVSNSEDSALTGSELILVTRTDSAAAGSADADPNASNGLLIDSGSVIRTAPLSDEDAAQPVAVGAPLLIAGDGALLRVSNRDAATVIRSNVSADGGRGLLQLGDGARVLGGRSLTLDASRDVVVDPTARFSARVIEANASSISFVADGVTATTGGLVIGSGTLAQLAASNSIRLRSSGLISFLGNTGTTATPDLAPLDIVLGDSALDLRATGFSSDGSDVSITARSLSFGGIGETAAEIAVGTTPLTNTLRLNVDSLRFGAGSTRLAGFGALAATVRDRVIGSGVGRFDFGSSDLAITAPLFTVDTAADTRLLTLGSLSLNDAASTAGSLDGGLGGALTLTASALDIDSRFVARAGLLNLQATSGDLQLGAAAELSVAGLARTFFDTTQFASAGAITLEATTGNVVVDDNSLLDIAAAAAGGDAGRITISALVQTTAFTGTGRVLGTAANGYEGGSYQLDVGNAVDLNAVAAALTAGGVNQQIAIHSRSGNLSLASGNRLTAREISLTADVPLTPVEGAAAVPAISAEHGNIVIDGTLDASGDKGGRIALNGYSGVTVNGGLLARGSAATERGGSVALATGTVATAATGGPGAALDPTFGYQSVSAANAGRLVLAAGSTIDVSGGRAGGLEGGTLNLRAGLVDGGEVNVDINAGATITGAREVGIEAYAVWSAADAGSGFNGVIDPANNPAFYASTLQGFLQQGELAFETRLAGVAGLKTRLGIELRNPDLTVNNGDITVASNWNLGAADLDANGNVLRFRYRHGDEAPVVTLRAANNVQVNASLSDGFVQLSNPLGLQAPRARSLAQVSALYEVLTRAYPALAGQIDAPTTLTGDGSAAQDAQIAQYYGLYEQYLNYLLYGLLPVGQLNVRPITALAPASRIEQLGVARLGLGAPQVPLNAQGYAQYLLDYNAYLARIEGGLFDRRIALPTAPRPVLAPVFTGAALASVDNSESPVSTAANPLPLAAASLGGGSSSSFRLIAGAESTSANVLALRPTSAFTGAAGVLTNGGNVFVSGNTQYTDPVTNGIAFQPTMIRTGTGSIDIAAARDFELNDGIAPGVVYTAGAPRTGTVAETGSRLLQPGLFDPRFTDGVIGSAAVGEYIVSGIVQPEAAGDIRLVAQRDITGVQSAYSNTSNSGQYWWQWLDTGNDVRYSLDSLHNSRTSLLVAGGIAEVLATSINFGAFGQGFLSVGGDIDVNAGRNISSLGVSLPTTYYRSAGDDGEVVVNTVGGGDLRVHAGGDLLSGSYFVAQGEGRIRADGLIGSSRNTGVAGLATILAVQDGVLDVAARGSVTLAGLYNPAYLPASLPGPLFSANSQAYSARSAVSVTATTGDLRYGSLPIDISNDVFGTGLSLPGGGGVRRDGDVLPATVRLTALDGSLSIEKSGGLFPSAVGNLSLFANDSIRFASTQRIDLIADNEANRDDRYFGLIDADPANLPSALNQPTAAGIENLAPSLTTGYRYISSTSNALLHARNALHASDYTPVRVYALNGDIRGGVVDTDGILRDALVLAPDKAALVQAGRDIVNLSFQGQHVHNSDVTRIEAGRDLINTIGGIDESVNGRNVFGSEPSLVLAGPGELQVVAGRNIGPLANQNQIIDGRSRPQDANNSVPRDVGSAPITGIDSVGNLFNPFLPRDGADITVQFGVGPGMATQAFIDRYIDPAATAPAIGVRRYDAELVRFIQDYQQGLDVNTGFIRDQRPLPPALLPGAAYAVFRALPAYIQQRLVGQVFFDVLRTVGIDFGNPDSPFNGQYVRGYQAIETLFPAASGYTANNLTGDGPNGALLDSAGNPVLATTGNLDLRGTTVQSQQGGTISIFGPGGEALLGSTSAPPFATDTQGRLFAGPGTQGLLSLEQGDIRVFTDRSLLLAQSRVFTEQGGNIVIWSSNADINAGRGARTTAELPLPSFTCNVDFYCLVDARGQVSGAGIATLQTVAGALPGDVALIAPAGTVDAGDAGIRVSGNLIVAARAVANADNVQVQGSSIGLRLSAIDSGTLNAGSAAAAAATQQAASLAARPVDRAATVITVEVYGFGSPDDEQKRRLQR